MGSPAMELWGSSAPLVTSSQWCGYVGVLHTHYYDATLSKPSEFTGSPRWTLLECFVVGVLAEEILQTSAGTLGDPPASVSLVQHPPS